LFMADSILSDLFVPFKGSWNMQILSDLFPIRKGSNRKIWRWKRHLVSGLADSSVQPILQGWI